MFRNAGQPGFKLGVQGGLKRLLRAHRRSGDQRHGHQDRQSRWNMEFPHIAPFPKFASLNL
jgi:hypothetical protein